MGVIAEMADRVVVMYAGRPCEIGPEIDVVRRPRHPYTWGLLGAVPRVDSKNQRLVTIPGTSVSPLDVPEGCAFAARCEYKMAVCEQRPELHGPRDHQDACWLSDEQRLAIRSAPVGEAS